MNQNEPEPAPAPARPVLRVVRGNPSVEELAALVTVVTAAARRASPSGSTPAPSRWTDRGRAVPTTLPHGPGAWRAFALPH